MSRPAQRGRRRGHAGRLDQLSAARRGDLEIDRRLYLDRLAAVREADDKAAAGGRLLAATARQLALRMSYEDVIRVAQAKIDPARFAGFTRDFGVAPARILTVTEFLKPGIDEVCSILPPWLATLCHSRQAPSIAAENIPLRPGAGDESRPGCG